MTAVAARTLRIGGSSYPVVLPSIRDPRLHLAGVIITIHVLGQTSLGFAVSVPQIVSAILACALIELVWTFVETRKIVWPASAMLTGSGVALILRIVGQSPESHWTWDRWYIFAAVAAASLLTKYLIRYRGSHLFNPSNVGLVGAFLLLGSSVIEPLDFWWGPLSPGLIAAYAVILGGGIAITSRLRLLPMAVTFWVMLAAALGVLAATGHCMTAAWALQPVCGFDFWRVVATSPELLIFVFFMITDPKTIPARPTGRFVWAFSLAMVCALLMAPQTTEFGAKVGLLAGLVVLCPVRGLFDRWATSRNPVTAMGSPLPVFVRGVAIGASLVLAGVAVVGAGTPARSAPQSLPSATVAAVEVEVGDLPPVSVGDEVAALSGEAASEADGIALALAEALAIERQAMMTSDTSLLRSADGGTRLVEMERAIEAAATAGERVLSDFTFDRLHLDVVHLDGPQGGAHLAVDASGVVAESIVDPSGIEVERAERRFDTSFVLDRGPGDRWVIVAEMPAG
jgi:hypothetical protein